MKIAIIAVALLLVGCTSSEKRFSVEYNRPVYNVVNMGGGECLVSFDERDDVQTTIPCSELRRGEE